MTSKDAAYEFLKSLHERLERELPKSAAMRAEVDRIVETAAADPSKKHLKGREQAFLNAIATPVVFQVLTKYPGMDVSRAKEAFLTESYRSLPEYSKGSPARRLRHPFNKALGVDSETIYRQWCGEGGRRPLTQSCPDFAFRTPFPHKILFEGKYFLGNSIKSAQQELVESVYQAFFYRGLPQDLFDKRRPDWDFDYACVFSYDASQDGLLREAWQRLTPDVKRGFWEGANVYVMVLRGTKD